MSTTVLVYRCVSIYNQLAMYIYPLSLSYVMNPRVAVTMKREREMNASTTAGLY
jgi:hypothetical protein